MKNLLVVLLVIIAAVFAWTRLRTPKLDGPEIPEGSRVLFVSTDEFVSVADHLNTDQWTLLLFTSSSAAGAQDLQRQFEVAVRTRFKAVRLVVVDVGSLSSPAARLVELKELPSAWLFDGMARKTDDLDAIRKMLK